MNVSSELDQNLYDNIVSLIVRKTRLKKEKIKPETTLLRGLGVDGMDAHDLLSALRDEFDVDFSDFEFNRHFGPEGWDLLEMIQCLFEPERRKKVPITVLDLYESAKNKKFPDLRNRPPV